jgi:hypothetical protein
MSRDSLAVESFGSAATGVLYYCGSRIRVFLARFSIIFSVRVVSRFGSRKKTSWTMVSISPAVAAVP